MKENHFWLKENDRMILMQMRKEEFTNYALIASGDEASTSSIHVPFLVSIDLLNDQYKLIVGKFQCRTSQYSQ